MSINWREILSLPHVGGCTIKGVILKADGGQNQPPKTVEISPKLFIGWSPNIIKPEMNARIVIQVSPRLKLTVKADPAAYYSGARMAAKMLRRAKMSGDDVARGTYIGTRHSPIAATCMKNGIA